MVWSKWARLQNDRKLVVEKGSRGFHFLENCSSQCDDKVLSYLYSYCSTHICFCFYQPCFVHEHFRNKPGIVNLGTAHIFLQCHKLFERLVSISRETKAKSASRAHWQLKQIGDFSMDFVLFLLTFSCNHCNNNRHHIDYGKHTFLFLFISDPVKLN